MEKQITIMNKPEALIFFQYLPPWRIDVFNEMAEYYNLTIAFTDADSEGFSYNKTELLKKLDKRINTVFLKKGFRIKQRPVKFGILRLIKKVKPEIIFSHEYAPTSVLVAFYRMFFHYRYIITTSDNLDIAQNVKGLKAIFRKYILNRADAIVVYSDIVKKWYKKIFPELRAEVCPNIQNPDSLLNYRKLFPPLIKKYKEKFNITNKSVLLYTGRLEYIKGLDLLLNAFAKSENKDFLLVLVGKGKEDKNLRQQCVDLKIEGRVVFAGFYTGVNLYAWYDIADFFILPSRFEPFGAVINESLVYGCPVLASKYIGATDLICNDNGLLFDPLNEKEFIKMLNVFYKRYNHRIKSGKNLMTLSFKQYVRVFFDVNN